MSRVYEAMVAGQDENHADEPDVYEVESEREEHSLKVAVYNLMNLGCPQAAIEEMVAGEIRKCLHMRTTVEPVNPDDVPF
jgi:hypothetical protein